MWKPGDHLRHRFNADLGPGLVLTIEGRSVVVVFPEGQQTLRFALSSDALEPLIFPPGSRARLETTGEVVTITATSSDGSCRLEDGREVTIADLWPLAVARSPIDQLQDGKIGSFEDFKNRLDALRLEELREADGLGSFLGGRIELFPHQLYAAEQACHSDPVRWLLADEVGLGKTVEACLILNRLLHTNRAERTLVVAPETLTVQWLGELWRKYHKIFVLLDDKRLQDITREHGLGFNPFDVHRRMIVSLERLAQNRRLVEQAVEAQIDLLVVDEAHHLRRLPGQPGNAAYRAVAPIAELGRHVLLLTATPLEDDAFGFFRLLQLLRPEDLPPNKSFEERLAQRDPLPPCTSATRRTDIGGLPPRVPVPVEIDDPAGWEPLLRLEQALRAVPAEQAPAQRRKARQIRRALASAASLEAVLPRTDAVIRELLEVAQKADPRLRWLGEQAALWAREGEKTLVFVAHRESLDPVRRAVERYGRVQVGIFHEDLSTERRDLEVARFRQVSGPSMLIATECGGEGRNFQFCRRLVLFDLPWNPAVVEQRIGRLDRIGRSLPTEIVYFRPPAGFGRALVGLYEAIGLFEVPLGALARELRQVTLEVERVALDATDEVDPEVFAPILEEARAARDRVQQAAYQELHRAPYQSALASGILARVPANLDRLIEDLVLRATARFGFNVEPQADGGWLVELGAESLIDRLPGVLPEARFLGTFDRSQAVWNEELDFFASGHPLVEGVLDELEEGPRGRVALLQLPGDEEIFGLLAIYKRGPRWEAVAVDLKGKLRPELARHLTRRDFETEKVSAERWSRQAQWSKIVRRLAKALPEGEIPQAVAAFRVRGPGKPGRPKPG